MTIAGWATAEKTAFKHLSQRLACRHLSLSRPNMIPMQMTRAASSNLGITQPASGCRYCDLLVVNYHCSKVTSCRSRASILSLRGICFI